MAQENIVLIGDPFIKSEVSDHLRSLLISLRTIDPACSLFTISKNQSPPEDMVYKITVKPHLTTQLSDRLNIFCMNLSHIEMSYAQIKSKIPKFSRNILIPFFEKEDFSPSFNPVFDYFDEIWSYSKFHHDFLKTIGISKPIIPQTFPGEARIYRFIPRRYFHLSENSFLFLTFFDKHHSFERQNIVGVLNSFSQLIREFPTFDTKLVIRGNISIEDILARFPVLFDENPNLINRMILISQNLSYNEEKNLIRHCDCTISLHRAISFGKPLAEAMFFSKPVIATAHSGNLDYMNENNALLVDFEFMPINADNQSEVWAHPNANKVLTHMSTLLLDQDSGKNIGEKASRHIRQYFNYQAIGLHYFDRINALMSFQT